MKATKKTSKLKTKLGKCFFYLLKSIYFLEICFLSPEINWFFSEIGNNPMRALGRKKTCFFWVMCVLNLMRARI